MEAHPLTFHGETLLRGGEGGVLPVPLGEGAWPGPTGRVSALASGPGGLLAAATEGGDITVWRAGGARPQTVIGHASVITSLAFDNEGGMLASGSLDNTVKIWNLRAPEDEPVSVDHGAWVWDVAFGPQGNLLASAGADRTVRLWPTDARRMAGQLCDRLEGGLAPDEWFRHVGSDIPYEETCASSTLQTLDALHEGASHAFAEH